MKLARLGVVFLLSAIITTALQAQNQIVGRMSIPERSFDFGTVREGQVVSHSFQVQNVGNADLQISRIVAGCGCTAVNIGSPVLAAGQTTTIKADLDTSGFSGTTRKSITVYSSDSDTPRITLTLAGKIDSTLVVEPSRIYFDNIIKGVKAEPQELKISIDPSTGKSLQGVRTFSKSFQIEKTSSNTFKIFIDSNSTLGEIRDRLIVTILNPDKTQELITVPVLAKINGEVSLQPAQISFGVLTGSQKLNRSVSLINNARDPLEILDIRADHRAIQTSFKAIRPGREYEIAIALNPAEVKSDMRSLIEIKTSNQTQPNLLLSIYAVVPPKLDY